MHLTTDPQTVGGNSDRTDRFAALIGDFSNPLSEINISSNQKISKI